MAKDFAKQFYNSNLWQQCKAGYILSVNGLCERHLNRGEIEPGFIVHHKIELTPENINNPEATLNWDNLEYLCQDCHNKEHHGSGEEVIGEGLTFNSEGELIQLPPLK